MPEITGVRERRGKARISVDGEFWAEIDAGVALECGLREGAVSRRKSYTGCGSRGEAHSDGSCAQSPWVQGPLGG